MCEARRCCLSIFTVCLAIIVYIVLGALAFFFLENHYQKDHTEIVAGESVSHHELDYIRNATVQRLWTLTMELNVFYESNWTQLAELELQKFQEDVLRHWYLLEESDYHRREPYNSYNDDTFENFPAALLYALTLITTIGYGSVSPKSLAGRVLTVFYAAIGIPLTLCYLATVGDFLSKCIRTIYYKIRCGKPKKGGCGVPIPVSLILVFSYLCGGAGVFWWLEGWPFVDAIFFCFASLATIGFGGMLDPHVSKHVSLLVSSVYILLGMALISTVFNLVQEEIVRGKSGRGRHYHRDMVPSENHVGLQHITLDATNSSLGDEYFVPKSMVAEFFAPQPNVVEMATMGNNMNYGCGSATLPRPTRSKTVTFEDEKFSSKEAPPDVFM